MIEVHHNGHIIKVKTFGTEKVYYDEKLVSSKFSILGSSQSFKVKEKGKEVQYDVEVEDRGIRTAVTIKRNGKIIFTNR